MQNSLDVVIIGAGAAGLTAAGELIQSGLSIIVLEARNRLGGRMFTVRDPVLNVPIELGAEFIHGLPPEIWQPLQTNHVATHEVEGENWCVRAGKLSTCDFFEDVNAILEQMDASLPDESFLRFLRRRLPESERTPHQREVLERAVGYVSGFNAADPDRVGIHWLVKGMEAEERIEGDRAFRAANGYHDLLEIMIRKLAAASIPIQTETVVSSLTWTRGQVELAAERLGQSCSFSARAALITVPLGVLKAPSGEPGTIRFMPGLPAEKLGALEKIEMGHAARVVLRFGDRFWENIRAPQSTKTLSNLGFLFSQDGPFPTWWSAMPSRVPLLTAWAPFRSAEELAGASSARAGEKAVASLSRLLQRPQQELAGLVETSYFHDWQSDPFSCGAYSYGAVGWDGAAEALGAPVENTLFFAGEATDITGNNGTVHGAVASGKRAACEIRDRLAAAVSAGQ